MSCIVFFLLTCGAINWGDAYALAFLLIVLLRQKMLYREIRLNFLYSAGFWLLICSCLSFVVIGNRNITALYHYGLLPTIAYIIGWCASEENLEAKITDLILAIVAGFAVHAMLNDLINIGNANRYTLTDFWTGSFRAATGSGVLNTMTISVFLYMFLIEKRKKVKYLYILLFLFTVHYMFLLGTRTQFAILIIVNLIGGVILFYRKSGLNGVLKLILTIVAVALCFGIAYQLNFLSIQDWIADTNLAHRFTDRDSLSRSDDFRFQSLWIGMKELFVYPLGGRIDQPYRHNMWLDVGRISGIIPCTLLVAYSALCLVKVWRIYKNKGLLIELRYLLISLYAGVFINYFVEPIWEGQLNFFLAMCLIDGMVNQVERRQKNESDSGKSPSAASELRENMR